MSPELMLQISQLLWREYSNAFENMKQVQEEEDDGTPDWDKFHQSRMDNAEDAYDTAFKFYDEFRNLYGDDIRKAFN